MRMRCLTPFNSFRGIVMWNFVAFIVELGAEMPFIVAEMPFIVATIIMVGHGLWGSLHNNTGTCLHASGEEYMQYCRPMQNNVLWSLYKISPSPDLCNQKDDHQFYFLCGLMLLFSE